MRPLLERWMRGQPLQYGAHELPFRGITSLVHFPSAFGQMGFFSPELTARLTAFILSVTVPASHELLVAP